MMCRPNIWRHTFPDIPIFVLKGDSDLPTNQPTNQLINRLATNETVQTFSVLILTTMSLKDTPEKVRVKKIHQIMMSSQHQYIENSNSSIGTDRHTDRRTCAITIFCHVTPIAYALRGICYALIEQVCRSSLLSGQYAGRVACCPLVSHDEYDDRTDRRTDRRTPDRYISLRLLLDAASIISKPLYGTSFPIAKNVDEIPIGSSPMSGIASSSLFYHYPLSFGPISLALLPNVDIIPTRLCRRGVSSIPNGDQHSVSLV